MDVKGLIDQYAAYDLWANTRLVDRLQREPDNVLDRHVKSSFPSLRATLMHIRDAECVWQLRLNGQPNRWPAEEGRQLDGLIKYCTLLHDHVRGLKPEELQAKVTYSSLRGEEFTQTRLQLLMHCFNHSSYHRGQVITLMRQLDLDEVPNTDLVQYQRMLSKRVS